ncbi:hypothetical protein TVAG_482710 [Trichomonas vaginalis G3]|uniref:Uncharacterized protein n=1 Tax=Trichomonas vaginalis (strain ATCC PRA-98 / G3) TaxID=412133 RepID=A2FRQ6_TRIV3|nr:hypothetical protein TVAGG3_0208700 [Trichomonas vaginalis G3]EAX92395.1 hypothetical protein TVAG_482710 [Trichomonas vaginalis G3]KAI5551089.1 hypothetical protein TVAGG3_0208700 [Trichomonas vaginalis G3]|eukprot:XP_001305325.1 hypothetical protein [Trichomonas vaginalis G3]
MKLIYDIEFPSNVLYSFNYYFDKNYDSKITEYIYGTNYNEHIERSINLPSSLTSSDHKLHYFFNATGLTTETFENSFSLLYHKPVINLLTSYDNNNPPIYNRYVNDSLSIEYEIEDEDLNDNVTSIVNIETHLNLSFSKIAPYRETVNINLEEYDLREGNIWITISAVDEQNCSASDKKYFSFIYKYDKPEIEFQPENNISRIDDFIRVPVIVRDYRHGLLTIHANITNSIYSNTKTKEFYIDDDTFRTVNIDLPINRLYGGNYTISICATNEHHEYSTTITSSFNLDNIPTFQKHNKLNKLKHPRKLISLFYILISKK